MSFTSRWFIYKSLPSANHIQTWRLLSETDQLDWALPCAGMPMPATVYNLWILESISGRNRSPRVLWKDVGTGWSDSAGQERLEADTDMASCIVAL